MRNVPPMIWNCRWSPVGWSGNSNNGVQGSDDAKRAPDDMELPLDFTLFTPTYRAPPPPEAPSALPPSNASGPAKPAPQRSLDDEDDDEDEK